MLRRLIAVTTLVVAGLAAGVMPAAACGGLVAANGAVRLSRATTAVEWQGGVEHYITSFTYDGAVTDVGWVVPLPAVPDSVVAAGRWTLQRLEREFAPPAPVAFEAAGAGHLALKAADVVLQTTVEALDITVLRGSAQAVVDWCTQHRFALNDETRAHIAAYAKASPIFMAARYDVSRARALGRTSGDGTPVLVTMHTPHLWVPLEVLANADDPVDADLFLLTPQRPRTVTDAFLGAGTVLPGEAVPGADGFVIAAQRPMSARLHADLASDRDMGWMPSHLWVTFLQLRSRGDAVTYDMAMTVDGTLQLAALGTSPQAAATTTVVPPPPATGALLGAALALPAALMLLLAVRGRRRRGAAPA